MERPRVLILGKLPPPYMGPAIATEIILNSSLNESFELRHFDTALNKSVAGMGKFRWSKLGDLRRKYAAYRRIVKKWKPDIILVPIGQTTGGFFKDAPFLKMGAKYGARVLVHLRGSVWRNWYERQPAPVKAAVRSAMGHASGAIVLDENLRGIFDGIFPWERIFVVPNGGNYVFPERKSSGLSITYLANFLPGKGFYELLQAIEILSKNDSIPPFELNAFGSWDDEGYRQKCRVLAQAIPQVKIHGSIAGDEKWQALANTDIFVFAPVAPEGHPWSVIEATAAGLPVLSTNRGAISQNVISEKNGFLLDNADPAVMADCLEKLLKDDTLRKKMGDHSRQLYEDQFTASKMVENLQRVFLNVLQNGA